MSASSASPTLAAAAKANWPLRTMWVLIAGMLFGLLATAFALTPEAGGLGTHQQLGLPPCTVRVVWDMRCPACGMTTSWAHLTRGQLWESVAANAGGFVLGWIAAATGCGFSFLALTGRRPPRWALPTLATVLIAAIAISLVDWMVRLQGAS